MATRPQVERQKGLFVMVLCGSLLMEAMPNILRLSTWGFQHVSGVEGDVQSSELLTHGSNVHPLLGGTPRREHEDQ